MDPSPLTQEARPETFQPKIVQLYEVLFEDDHDLEKSEGFWQEFFLLKPDKANLQHILADRSADELLHQQAQTRQLFSRAIHRIKVGAAPSDEIALDVSRPSGPPLTGPHRLTSQTLTVFLGSVLTKKYTNPSSDIISVLAGLDLADSIFTEFVGALDVIIRNGRTLELRQKAVEVALSVTSGAYQTGLISYFTHRDLFPSLMKYIQDSDTHSRAFEPFVLLGLLANYNKFEFQNPYRLRLDDFVNEATIQRIVRCVGSTCSSLRDGYVAVQDDLPEGWSFGGTLSMLGLGALTSSTKPQQAPNPDVAKVLFAELPGPEAAVLLSAYDFVHANKLFCFNLVSLPAEEKQGESAFGGFLSFTSYLLQHAHRSTRSSFYVYLNLFILQILVEDPVLCKRICSDESKIPVRLCRQRQPYLPLIRGERVLAGAILDTMIDGINHNLRRRLDVVLYSNCVGLLLRIISFLTRSRIRLAYHWSELWRSLLSLIRFLTTYAADIKPLSDVGRLLDGLVNVIAFALSAGDAFLPDAASYDDLFYKLVEAGDTLVRFRDAYDLAAQRAATNAIDTLVAVSAHYTDLLASEKGQSRMKTLSPREVNRVIRGGYETLAIQARDGLDAFDPFREADKKATLKKGARVAVADVKGLLLK
ncbi:MAG: hypothetical protein M1819_002196 [Sarea resinae]|nr:MAG: hypothetical protein M1819_002196 [Sarea resinae]